MDRFTVSDYQPYVFGSGAEKLEDSQIAPLVAAVRGYRTYIAEDSAAKAAKIVSQDSRARGKERHKFEPSEVRQYFQNGGDLMMMPWYQAGTVLSEEANLPTPHIHQIRPENPRMEKDGDSQRPIKYVFPKSGKPPLSVHPVFYHEWAQSAPRMMVTEGVLKEDSLITGMLLANGETIETLKIPDDVSDSPDEFMMWAQTVGRDMLRKMIDRIPETDRLLPLSTGGVNNWHPTMFQTLPMRGKQAILAFDGDVASNPNVWREAQKMWELFSERDATPVLLALGSSAAVSLIRKTEKFANVGVPVDGKVEQVGVDDFMSHVAPFNTMLTFLEDELPPRPADDRESYNNGEWRVNDEGTSTEEFRTTNNDLMGSRWIPRVPIGGRVRHINVSRAPSLEEIRQGTIHAREDHAVTQYAQLMLEWENERTGVRETIEFEIEVSLLSTPPDRWPAKVLNTLPAKLSMHPEWPPVGMDGVNWMKAIKRNSGEDWMSRRAWEATGWAPTQDSDPVYTVGEQVLGRTREDERTTTVGVDDSILPNSSDFGVDDIWWETVDPDGTGEISPDGLQNYKNLIKNDIRTVLNHFVKSPAWGSEKHFYGVIALGAAYRNTLPQRPTSALYLRGTPGSGKSWTASMIMGAWQNRKNVWNANHLPGSASSTAFAMEKIFSVAGAGVWVADDLAPSVSQQAAINAEAAIESVIRALFNNSPRQRGTKDGGIAKSAPPRAFAVITAENPLSTTSALERLIELQFESNMMDSGLAKALIRDAIDSLAMSRVTAAMIRFWHQPHKILKPIEGGEQVAVAWQDKVTNLEKTHEALRGALSRVLEHEYGIAQGKSERRVQLISEIMLPLFYLFRLYEWCNTGDNDPDMETLLMLSPVIQSESFGEVKRVAKSMGTVSCFVELIELASRQLDDLSEQKNGANLLRALSNVLDSGEAHLENASTPGAPPILDESMHHINTSLGWSKVRGEWQASGRTIGRVGYTTDGTLVALFNQATSFSLAQQRYPSLVPHGQKQSASWQSAAAEQLLWSPNGDISKTVQKIQLDGHRRTGVPVEVSRLTDMADEDEDDTVGDATNSVGSGPVYGSDFPGLVSGGEEDPF